MSAIEIADKKIKIACCSPRVHLMNPDANASEIIALAAEADTGDVSFMVFPELALTGYTCGDAFFQRALLDAARAALDKVARETAALNAFIIVGLPLHKGGKIYDAAAMIRGGSVVKTVFKKKLSDNFGLQESRYFASSEEKSAGFILSAGDREYSAEICIGEDYKDSPADLVLNPFCGREYLGEIAERKTAAKLFTLTGRTYAGAGAGFGESTSDFIFSGLKLIASKGKIPQSKCARKTAFILESVSLSNGAANPVSAAGEKIKEKVRISKYPTMPYLPGMDNEKLLKRAFDLQCRGLAGRLTAIGCEKVVIGVSGGLDSTLALLVAGKTFDMLGLDRKNIYGITMPCFGTGSESKKNAVKLMKLLGVSSMEINIRDAVSRHFKDINHDESVKNAAFENAQARERTQVLMDIANDIGAIVVGTGDLSEIALGWCTYGGDHLSMYDVNAGVPKTLIRKIVSEMAKGSGKGMRQILSTIVDQPVSPELLPPEDGKVSQKTEEILGDYEVHDFILYYVIEGYSPDLIFSALRKAFSKRFDDAYLLRTLKTFYRRFFSSQFKRSCSPEGPQILSFGLSPRGGLLLPGDAKSDLWLSECEKLSEKYNINEV